MFKLDNNLLIELGLGSLPTAEKNKMLAHIYEELELRVGMRLAQQMSDQQLTEFETFIDSGNEAGALQWLETNFPDYKSVVADELELLKAEIKQQAPQMLEIVMAEQAQSSNIAPTNQPTYPQQIPTPADDTQNQQPTDPQV